MLVAILFVAGAAGSFGFFEENELSFEIAIMLVVDDWTLNREMNTIHERFAVGAKISMRVAFCKLLFGHFDSFLLLFRLFLLGLLNYPNVRFS